VGWKLLTDARDLDRVEIFFRAPYNLYLFGIPYRMREGQQPGDLWRAEDEWEERHGAPKPWGYGSPKPDILKGWLLIPEPGTGTFDKLASEDQRRVRAFLARHRVAVPQNPSEWSELSHDSVERVRATAALRTGFCGFETWTDVLTYARRGELLYYHAPLDIEPVRLWTFEVRPRTIRIWPPGSEGRGRTRTADPFTADHHHLDRFRRLCP